MQDPSSGIHRELIPHVHLVSTYRFPLVPSLHHDKVTEWLLGAPKITRDQAPFYWTYLDRPQDGTILLVWQSMSLGTDYPSDGYIWAPTETAFQLEVNGGYTLEMYHQKTGYAPGEQFATHARRRYRLLPSKFPNSPMPDTGLWIVHYTQCEPQDRLPSSVIPIDHRVNNIMQTRQYLHQQGQIVQKEFMLHDRSNWPQIQFPRGPPRGPQIYGGNIPQARVPQSMAYPTPHPTTGPPAKRVRVNPNVPTSAGGAVAVLEDDEEDTSRGDFFDVTSPREVSASRYKQNHEWMEEILSSPYAINQIIPADLGLGVRGELASLTDGFFDAPYDPDKDTIKNNYVGRLDPEKASEFRQRATERIEQTNKDIEKMKAKHAKRLAKFKKGSLISRAEKELRSSVANPSDVGPEYWRLEGKIDEEDSEDGKADNKVPSKVEDILAQVEASLGRHAVAVQELRRIQDGGFEEAAAAPPSPVAAAPSPSKSVPQSANGTPQSGVLVTDADMDIGNSAAGLLDQYHTGLSSNATPGSNFPTPQAHLQSHSTAGTPGMHVPSPQASAHASPQPQASVEGDVNMADSADQITAADAAGSGDWVVVPPGGISPGPANTTVAEASTTATVSAPTLSTTSPHPATTTDNTPLPDFSTSPNDFADLGDLDTAGDALAGYGDDLDPHHGDMGDDLGLDLDVGMDDSAFGEAFHGIEPRDDGGEENHGEGM